VGSAVVPRLDGMFAFAWFEAKSETIHLCRDSFGIKPLYFAHDGAELLFASQPMAILKLKPNHFKPNSDAHAAFLLHGYLPPGVDAWSGISELRPGEWMSFETSTLNRSLLIWPESEIKAIEPLIEKSLDSTLISDRPVAVLLSGGVDSSLVSAIVAKKNPHVKAFSLAFSGSFFDESIQAAEVAKNLGIEFERVVYGREEFRESWFSAWNTLDTPLADAAYFPLHFLCQKVSKTHAVALSGDGGDEMFAGYEKYRALKLRNSFPWLAPLTQFPLGALLGPNGSARLAKLRRIFNAPTFSQALGEAGTAVSAADVSRLVGEKISPWKLSSIAGSFWAIVQSWDLQCALPQSFLVKSDRASMAHGLELRPCFLAPAMSAWSIKQDFEQLVGKKPLKALLAKLIPIEIWSRPKAGFTAPILIWVNDYLENEINDLSKRAAPSQLKPIAELIARSQKGDTSAATLLWHLLCWDTWERHWS
jgi:asparagine synthase (glutamine-hydrolysing)